MVLAVSVINLVMFLYASVLLWDELKGRRLLKTAESPNPSEQLSPTTKKGELPK